MRREVFGVVEAARSLQVLLAPSEASPHGIRIGCTRSVFPERLRRLAKALEAFDRAGAASLGAGNGLSQQDPAMDAARLRVALDGVFRWMRSSGMDVSEPHSMVVEALGVLKVQGAKAGKSYRPVPRFAPNGFKKAKRPKPLLVLIPGADEKVSVGLLAAKETEAQMTEISLGQAAPTARPRH